MENLRELRREKTFRDQIVEIIGSRKHLKSFNTGCGEYSDIRIYSNIFRYKYSFVSYSYHFFDANIFRYSFVLFFWYEYIRIFVRIIFLIRIYSDIRSYRFFIRIYSNIFRYKYSFVSYSYHFFIRIYSDIRSYRFLDINIFEYSFVSKIYIRHTLHWKCCSK